MDETGEPAPRRRGRRVWLIGAAVVVGVLALLGVGVGVVHHAVTSLENPPLTFGDERATPPASAPAAASGASPAVSGAAAQPVGQKDDLAQVCDGRYFPRSPKFAGKAPHQISVGVVDSMVTPHRRMLSAVLVPDPKESVWRAWAPDNPAKSQLVACVDLTRAGKKLKTCKYDGVPVALNQGVYRLRLYEAATGRKLLDKPVTGANANCPSVTFLAEGESLSSQVDDRQLYQMLRGFVMKKP